MLDFRNTNTVWASVLAETLAHLGLQTVVISPGSRSTPLTIAFANHPHIQAIPMLDERSASFFALGVAKASGQPTALVCTSGTAGANYFPAIIEAYESGIPLMVLTADRPPELRDCASGQTIDQQKLFGDYVRGYRELALPEATMSQLRYLRQTIAQLYQQSQFPVPGPVHVNCPFRDPLAPISTGTDLAQTLADPLNADFFAHLKEDGAIAPITSGPPHLTSAWQHTERGLIIAGPQSTPSSAADGAYCKAIATLAHKLGWPVLADGLSPLRNHASLNPHLITTYDLLLRHEAHAQALVPEQVIQLGALPTSKVLRQWLTEINPHRWIIDSSGRNRDPLHGRSVVLPITLDTLIAQYPVPNSSVQVTSPYCQQWLRRNERVRQRLREKFETVDALFEGKLSWLLPSLLPSGTPLMIANSMPVRDVEWFWPLSDRGIRPYFSRGANGIDGTLSTALGIAHHHGQAVLLTGDLALLHDSNGFLNASTRSGHLTILLVNNQGGGIFESLPIAQFEPPFEKFFATPQAVDFATLAAAHQIDYELVANWSVLADRLHELPTARVRLLELKCDRKLDAAFRAELLRSVGDFTLPD
ncbi:2-succinyl-5-enolpyruvyl-6-hydroxy-3-cyclohexene-1-carboxylic-acid synthase [Leptolyngbya iicbica]|uniref:2-succinyl-5-enolpyruvyl-6-hydroxy-3-cyclohexene-1-carboxylate synthase n=2 Tax=Cyanophyceae TaxID=3028117 RepID=A0A4Q7EH84_9CYAN|nr:2-succinyl-5-enolpyruvyl-6-hydroxy-3-cyclohexene-1-carboxylic-acid synthase [Leptolyngbya sp. LK]RZM82683.1 2-succinyl-5-enolpyruvyl-6-hydroxy-3-cyclohexene-1-carboxylic-acid synthase [Leptolyngbya sp. LK]